MNGWGRRHDKKPVPRTGRKHDRQHSALLSSCKTEHNVLEAKRSSPYIQCKAKLSSTGLLLELAPLGIYQAFDTLGECTGQGIHIVVVVDVRKCFTEALLICLHALFPRLLGTS